MVKQFGKARDHNEPEIVEALRNMGAYVLPLHPPAPDLLVAYKGELLLMEVKGPDGELTEGQRKMRMQLQTQDCQLFVVRTVGEALGLLRT